MRIRRFAATAAAALVLSGPNTYANAAEGPSPWSFPDTAFGSAGSPLPFKQNPALSGWDLLVHEMEGNERDGGYGDTSGVPAFLGQHGPQCDAPTSGAEVSRSHVISSLYGENGDGGMAFTCKNHLMLTNHCQPDCFSSTVLTLPRQLDWSRGPATLSFDMSTRHTADADWIELFLTPFQSQLGYPSSLSPYEDNVGPPATGLGFAFGANLPPDAPCSPATGLSQCGFDMWSTSLADWSGQAPGAGGDVRDNVRQAQLTDLGGGAYLEEAVVGIEPANNGRVRYNLTVSSTHMTLGLAPQYQQPAGVILNPEFANGLNWVDSDLTDNPLPYTRAVVQFVAQDYGACKYQPTDPCAGIDTWHLSGFSMSSAAPLQIIRANRNWVDASTGSNVSFPTAAPANAYLRACFYGDPQQAGFSNDGGATWQALKIQPSAAEPGFYACSLTPIPAGTLSIQLTGADKYRSLNNPWHYEGVSIVSESR